MPGLWGGGGGTDSLRLGTNCETTAPPLFDKGQPMVLLSPNLQPPLLKGTQEQPLEIKHYCICHILANHCIKSFQELI